MSDKQGGLSLPRLDGEGGRGAGARVVVVVVEGGGGGWGGEKDGCQKGSEEGDVRQTDECPSVPYHVAAHGAYMRVCVCACVCGPACPFFPYIKKKKKTFFFPHSTRSARSPHPVLSSRADLVAFTPC